MIWHVQLGFFNFIISLFVMFSRAGWTYEEKSRATLWKVWSEHSIRKWKRKKKLKGSVSEGQFLCQHCTMVCITHLNYGTLNIIFECYCYCWSWGILTVILCTVIAVTEIQTVHMSPFIYSTVNNTSGCEKFYL